MSTTFQLNADGFTKQALQLCGLVPLGRQPRNDQLQDARDILSTILKSLQARGVTLTQSIRRTVTLTSGTADYTLGTDVIDVEFPTTIQPIDVADETWVEKMAYGDWRTISNKETTGRPTRVFVEKLSTCVAHFWDVPDQSYTWNYRAITLLPDMSSGTTEPSLTQRWMAALVWRHAYWLSHAFNLPMAKRVELKDLADTEEARVLNQENERVDLCLSLPSDPYRSY